MADNKRMKKSAAKSYWDKAVKKSSAANRTKASGKKPKKPGEYSRTWRPASKASEGPKKSMKRSAGESRRSTSTVKASRMRQLTPAEVRARKRAEAKRRATSSPRKTGEPANRIKSIRPSGTSAKRPRKTARLEYRGMKK